MAKRGSGGTNGIKINASWWLSSALATTRTPAPARQALVRGDSAFCTHQNVSAAIKAGAWYSYTIPAWPTVTRAIGRVSQDAWAPIRYPNAIKDPDTGELIFDAEVAEIAFTSFTSRRKDDGSPAGSWYAASNA